MNLALIELSERLGELTEKCDNFSNQIRQNYLPASLKPGNHFLGAYEIIELVSYNKIEKQKLMQYKSVFGHELEKDEVKRLDPSTINTQSPLTLQGKA